MVSISQSLHSFLSRQHGNTSAGEVVDQVLRLGTQLELQVDVNSLGGQLVEGTNSTFSDGAGNTWHPIRVPANGHAEPYFDDSTLTFELDQHVESIAATGWHWFKRQSLWCAFDIESIVAANEIDTLQQEKLSEVRQSISKLKYVEMRRSIDGTGLYVYVYLPSGVNTNTHIEHAAVARAVLKHISDEIGYDLCAQAHLCGACIPLWARGATEQNRGLTISKPVEALFAIDLSDWRSHIPVVSRNRSQVPIKLPVSNEELFVQLIAGQGRAELNARHIEVRNMLVTKGGTAWSDDHHVLQSHTVLLKQLKDEGQLDIQGVFDTAASRTEQDSPNCFLAPLEGGGWRVFRCQMGAVEHKIWSQDAKGWTTALYDHKPTFLAAANAYGGRILTKGGAEFGTLNEAALMIRAFVGPEEGAAFDIPEKLATRRATVKQTGEKLVVQVSRIAGDGEFAYWNSSDKQGSWTQVIPLKKDQTALEVADMDNVVRCLETPSRDPAGWSARLECGRWSRKSTGSIKLMLQSYGNSKNEAEVIMGQAERRTWMLVTKPFAPEYPGERKWNQGAPQLAFVPAPPNDGQASQHTHWDRMFDHIGQTLNSVLRDEPWAIESGIVTGRQYLMAWYASILRYPLSHLPYLFLYGPENSGKSIFHEAFSLLVTCGVVKADSALTADFNGELEGCILAVVEERNVANVKGTHAKIKDYVNAQKLSIRRMRTDAYEVPNTSHWVQCSNDIAACPVFPGDTRITVLNVPKLESEIPKDAFKALLRKEAPCLLATLLSMRLPTPTTRLRLPVVETYEKTVLALNNTTQVQLFVDRCCETGDYISVADFNTAFEKMFGDKPDNRELQSLMSTRTRIRKGPSVTRKIDGKTTRVIVGLVLNDYGLKLMQPPAANGSPTCVPLLGPFSTTSGVESIL